MNFTILSPYFPTIYTNLINFFRIFPCAAFAADLFVIFFRSNNHSIRFFVRYVPIGTITLCQNIKIVHIFLEYGTSWVIFSTCHAVEVDWLLCRTHLQRHVLLLFRYNLWNAGKKRPSQDRRFGSETERDVELKFIRFTTRDISTTRHLSSSRRPWVNYHW